MWDVLPILTEMLDKYVKDYACPMEAAFLASGEVKHHPAHVEVLPPRRIVPFNEKRNFTKKLVKARRDEDDHGSIPVVSGEELSPSRMVMIDSGATNDMLKKVWWRHVFRNSCGNLSKPQRLTRPTERLP